MRVTITGEDSSANSGPITFHGGTGGYTSRSGHGVDVGTASGGQGVGEIPVCSRWDNGLQIKGVVNTGSDSPPR
jgi:hypothetical protein